MSNPLLMFLASILLATRPEPNGVVPSQLKIDLYKKEITGFLHFGVNTYTDQEWGNGQEDEKIFTPNKLNATQWVETMQKANVKQSILTLKHHDGFCLWPSSFTNHSVKSSTNWKNGQGDVAREFTDACKKLGMRAGFYLSPWDRNNPSYGTGEAYNTYFKNQLTEIMTNYGEIDEIWFDNAKGEDKQQTYDFDAFNKICYDLQPKLLVHASAKPDIRWNGNENGKGADPVWATCNESVFRNNVTNTSYFAHGDEFGDIFTIVEGDVSIRPGWFYHASQDSKVKNGSALLDIYLDIVGHNQILLLNIPPNRDGLFHPTDVKNLEDFGRAVNTTFKTSLFQQGKATANDTHTDNNANNILNDNYDSFWAANGNTAQILLERQNNDPFDIIMLQEYIPLGQRIQKFWIYDVDQQEEKLIFTPNNQSTIGYKRYIKFNQTLQTKKFKIVVQGHAGPILNAFALYKYQLGKEEKVKFEFNGTDFLMNDKKFQFRSGEMHPSRIPHQYWRHRIQMAKAMGLNSLAIYVFWNIHEIEEGKFDFSSPQNNISRFIEIAQEENIFIQLRPGPYVCGEWDFGGIPSYLMRDKNLKIRTINDTNFKNAVDKYFQALATHVIKQMHYNGGNILMVQIENEYGHWAKNRQDKAYMDWMKARWTELGIKGPFYTADSARFYDNVTHIAGTAMGLDGHSVMQADWEQATKVDPNVPIFVAETYAGWLKHWGEGGAWTVTDLSKEVTWYMQNYRSFNFYVAHGGTNFDIWAGSNGGSRIQPDLTSYDYGAPINESGHAVNNYQKYRDIIFSLLNEIPPKIPEPIKTIKTGDIQLKKIATLFDQKVRTEQSEQPMWFEYYNQNQGFGIYRTTLKAQDGGILKFQNIRDYAQIYLNNQYIDTINTVQSDKREITLPEIDETSVLEIIVDTFGHKNYGTGEMDNDRKGIYGDVTLNGKKLTNWSISLINVQQLYKNLVRSNTHNKKGGIFEAKFTLTEIGDTFLEMGDFKKGMVWVNGYNLGRYWNIGGQKCLYLPGVWLNSGENTIIVVESEESIPTTIKGCQSCQQCK